ncbi:unnamed protein product [Durusdinium trenchii]|uniref:Uncharacterized protein n=1 Tax=Durusdinium trenchii TaxID=1381693 RepID=A0ABP0P9P7_9DINO
MSPAILDALPEEDLVLLEVQADANNRGPVPEWLYEAVRDPSFVVAQKVHGNRISVIVGASFLQKARNAWMMSDQKVVHQHLSGTQRRQFDPNQLEQHAPEAVVPKAVVPEEVVPEEVVPEAVVPEAVVPEAVVPEAVVPEAVEGSPEKEEEYGRAAKKRKKKASREASSEETGDLADFSDQSEMLELDAGAGLSTEAEVKEKVAGLLKDLEPEELEGEGVWPANFKFPKGYPPPPEVGALADAGPSQFPENFKFKAGYPPPPPAETDEEHNAVLAAVASAARAGALPPMTTQAIVVPSAVPGAPPIILSTYRTALEGLSPSQIAEALSTPGTMPAISSLPPASALVAAAVRAQQAQQAPMLLAGANLLMQPGTLQAPMPPPAPPLGT